VHIFTNNPIELQLTVPSINFQVQNPLFLQLQVISIQSTAGLNGTELASFTHFFKDFVVPPFGSANSGSIPNVTLTQGAANSLDFIPDGILDVNSTLSLMYAPPSSDSLSRSLSSRAGIVVPIPFFPYNQASVPTNYIIEG
jgi:hypothetical protein